MRAEARGTRTLWGALTLTAVLVVSACGGSSVPREDVAATNPGGSGAYPSGNVAMPRPGPYDRGAASADILVQSNTPLPAQVVSLVQRTKHVDTSVQFSMASFYNEEEPVTYAAVDPATFRAFTYGSTAALDEVWDRVADGEIALRSDLKERLATTGDYIALGNDQNAQRAHIGAYAPLVERSKIGAVLNQRWAAQLGMPEGNAMLVSTGERAPDDVLVRLRKQLKPFGVTVSLLAPDVDPGAAAAAVLTGGSVASQIRGFTYTANRDGTINIDPKWVAEYIRTEQVPILGTVRCNKVMLVQLRLALGKVQRAGLASKIHVGEYGGCYVPRFIANDPSRGLSFHSFGTAVDLNVPGNLRGSVGEIDRRVVDIFIRCGFSWGGTWNYTDPMHFELARLVSTC